jgi:RecA-family ATPase
MSSLLADGGVGKTALRYAQLVSLAAGRPLTGEYVFQRSRVLIVSLEDNKAELQRRILAVRLHHRVELSELKDWLFLAAPGAAGGKLMVSDKSGRLVRDRLADRLEAIIEMRKIDLVYLDPFVKSHSVEENSNSAIDEVAQLLTDIGAKYDIAIDSPHHTSKGSADPGNANRGRGASAHKDAGRLVYTASPMTVEEAQALGVSEELRRLLVRVDSAKVNIAPPMTKAKWFKLVGVKLAMRPTYIRMAMKCRRSNLGFRQTHGATCQATC